MASTTLELDVEHVRTAKTNKKCQSAEYILSDKYKFVVDCKKGHCKDIQNYMRNLGFELTLVSTPFGAFHGIKQLSTPKRSDTTAKQLIDKFSKDLYQITAAVGTFVYHIVQDSDYQYRRFHPKTIQRKGSVQAVSVAVKNEDANFCVWMSVIDLLSNFLYSNIILSKRST